MHWLFEDIKRSLRNTDVLLDVACIYGLIGAVAALIFVTIGIGRLPHRLPVS